MREKTGRTAAGMLAALLVLTLMIMSVFPVLADGEVQRLSGKELTKYNVELVIDGSGSLVSGSGATDPEGLRYEAINLFLALLTNKGNNAGAVVFDDNSDKFLLDTGLMALDGKADKEALASEIRDAGTGGDTDIGSALLEAVNTLVRDGDPDKQSVVILFSDGRTDLGDDKDALDQSLENKETAIETAQDKGIPVYTICLAASDTADPAELQAIASRTSGEAAEVSRPEDLADAFEEFYRLIFNSSGDDRLDDTFPAGGQLSYDLDVPTYGAEEVNVVLRTDEVKDISLESPSGNWTESQVEDAIMSGGNIEVLKISDPEAGTWHLTIEGNEGDTAAVNIIYNVDTEADLATADQETDYAAGDTVRLTARLLENGEAVTDDAVTDEYKAAVCLTDNRTGDTRTEDMEPQDDGTFSYALQTDDYDSYDVYAVLRAGEIELVSKTITLNFGNSAPTLTASDDDKSHTISVLVTPLTGRKKKIDVSKYFSDDQDSTLRYTLVRSQLVDGTAALDGNTLNIDTAKSRSGDVVIRGADSQGAYVDLTLHFKVHNWTLPIMIGFFAIVAGIIAAVILGIRAAMPLFRGNMMVSNLATGMRFPRGSFRGKIMLSAFPIGTTGFDPKNCWFRAERGNTVSFHAKQPFFANGQRVTDFRLFAGTTNYIYADEQQMNGIIVELKQY